MAPSALSTCSISNNLRKDTLHPFPQEGTPSPLSEEYTQKAVFAFEKNRRPLLRDPCKTGNKSQSLEYIRNSYALRRAQQAYSADYHIIDEPMGNCQGSILTNPAQRMETAQNKNKEKTFHKIKNIFRHAAAMP